jgi:hypothetical protein
MEEKKEIKIIPKIVDNTRRNTNRLNLYLYLAKDILA